MLKSTIYNFFKNLNDNKLINSPSTTTLSKFYNDNKLLSTLLILASSTILFNILKSKIINKKKVELKDKFVVITGASSGIGLELSKEFAKKGSKVILIARSIDKLKNAIKDIENNGNYQCNYISADLSKESDINNCIKQIENLTSSSYVEILINCAGSGNWKYIEETSFNENIEMMSLPYFSAFNITKLLINKMILNGEGTIVNINSPVSLNVWGGCIGYACSRWAFRGFTECLRFDLQGTGVNVLEVIPGETRSDYFVNNGIGAESFPYLSSYLPKVTVDQIAKATINGVENRKKRILLPMSLSIAKYFTFYPFSILINNLMNSDKSKTRLNNIKKLQNDYKLKKQREQQEQPKQQEQEQQSDSRTSFNKSN